MDELDVKRLLLGRRENYGVSQVEHATGRVHTLILNGELYNAVILVTSFDFYRYRYHIADIVPTLVVCYEHTTVLSVPVLSMRLGNLAKPYELPEDIVDVPSQRRRKIGTQVLLGQYICGVRAAQDLIKSLPTTTRKRYLAKAKTLGKHRRGKPVGYDPSKTETKKKWKDSKSVLGKGK